VSTNKLSTVPRGDFRKFHAQPNIQLALSLSKVFLAQNSPTFIRIKSLEVQSSYTKKKLNLKVVLNWFSGYHHKLRFQPTDQKMIIFVFSK
jgi:hypothetical protein